MPSSTQRSESIEGRLSDLLPDPVFCIDRRSMTFTEVNRAACSRLGYTAEELRTMGPYQICPREDVAALAAELEKIAAQEAPSATLRTRQQRKDGLVVPVEWHVAPIRDSAKEYWIVVTRELSADGRPVPWSGEADAEWHELGIPGHDPLTGLPDRRLFERRLDRALERTRRSDGYKFAVCFIDLDNFKAVNDTHGHLIGDRVLCEVARRLAGCVRAGDMVARFGGDEFTVLVDDLHDDEEAMLVARRVLAQMAPPIAVEGRSVKVVASIGIAAGSPKYQRIEDLLHDADRAMYRVKAQGGGDCLPFSDEPGPALVKPH